jgi:hypothetical protein
MSTTITHSQHTRRGALVYDPVPTVGQSSRAREAVRTQGLVMSTKNVEPTRYQAFIIKLAATRKRALHLEQVGSQDFTEAKKQMKIAVDIDLRLSVREKALTKWTEILAELETALDIERVGP